MSNTNSLISTSSKQPIIIMILTCLVSMIYLIIYLHGSLQGNFNHFIMPAEKFGVPAELKEHGLTVMYKGPIETGWDGQFYYYIANDIFARKDTSQHIDSSAYRYQRIGFPLTAKLVSNVLGQSWVSPLTYYLTALIMILIATYMGSRYFQKNQLTPYLILLWSAGCGTQVTLLHGLPDCVADAFLIIALISLVDKRYILYSVSMTFAVLSREVYFIFPCFICFAILINSIYLSHSKFYLSILKNCRLHFIPIIVFLIWQIFIRLKFHIAPSSQASGVLYTPLLTALNYIQTGYSGTHATVGAGQEAFLEATGIFFFLTILIINIVSVIALLKKYSLFENTNLNNVYISGIGLSFLTLSLLYFCFGPTVMMRYTGYFKAANIFLFVIPFIACLLNRKLMTTYIFYLSFITLFFNYMLWESVSEPPYHPSIPINYVSKEPTCLKDFRVKITPQSLEEPSSNFLKKVLIKRSTIFNVKITNQSSNAFSPFQGKGSVNLSYQWVDANTLKVIKDGHRTELPNTLPPKHSINIPVYIYYPTKAGDYLLQISLVQEGCSWFYLTDPNSALTIPFSIR